MTRRQCCYLTCMEIIIIMVYLELAYLGDDEVTVVERGSLDLYHDIVLAHLGQLCLTELEAIKALLSAGNSPLLHS